MFVNRIIVALSMDSDVVDTIDRKRGLVPRSRFVENVIQKSLRSEN